MLHPTMPVLLKAKRRGFVNRVQDFYRQSKWQFFLVLGMGLFLSLILFGFFYGGFRFIQRNTDMQLDLQEIIIQYIFALFFFAIFLMLMFSGTIITYSLCYKGRHAAFLLSSPVPFNSVFFISFIDSVIFSSWAFIFLAFPVLLAYGLSFKLNLLFYPLSILALFPFLLIPASLAGIIVLLVGLLPRGRRKTVTSLLVILIILPLIAVGVKVFLAEKEFGIMNVQWVEEVFRHLNFARSPLLPSSWAARIVTSFGGGDWAGLGMAFLLLLSNALFWAMIAHLVAGRLFIRGWNVVQNFSSGRSFRRRRVVRFFVRLIPLIGKRVRMILEKDIRTFIRDPAQWSQFFIFFGLIGLYFLNLRSFGYHTTDLRWKSIIAFLNLSAVCMTLATLNSRFVFPQVSLEGRKFWIIGLMPVKRKDIVMGKFYFAFLSGWLISSALIILSDFMLDIHWNIWYMHLYTVFLVSFALAGISVGAGALWPNFSETVPSKIVSGIGGTINLILSVFFVIMIIFVEAIPFHYYVMKERQATFPPMNLTVTILSAAAVLSLGSGLLFLGLGIRRFRKMEVF